MENNQVSPNSEPHILRLIEFTEKVSSSTGVTCPLLGGAPGIKTLAVKSASLPSAVQVIAHGFYHDFLASIPPISL